MLLVGNDLLLFTEDIPNVDIGEPYCHARPGLLLVGRGYRVTISFIVGMFITYDDLGVAMYFLPVELAKIDSANIVPNWVYFSPVTGSNMGSGLSVVITCLTTALSESKFEFNGDDELVVTDERI